VCGQHLQAGAAPSLLIVAGEASGDQYGAALVQALRQDHPRLQIYGLGGAHMRLAGVESLSDIEALNVLGAVEMLAKIPRGFQLARALRAEAVRRGTRVAVLIDAPGFNIPLARWLKGVGLRVVYYVSPQIWAWRQGRVKKIARRVDKMLTLFPFEVPLYTVAGLEAECVGHPLVDRLQSLPTSEQAAAMCGLDSKRPTVALLPGSRRQEIQYLLPAMLQAFQLIKARLPQVQGVLPVAATLQRADIQAYLGPDHLDVTVLQGHSVQALCAATFAIVASGTATLEAGVIGTPMVVIYKVHPITAILAWCFLRVPCVGLVNIVAGKQLVPELLQRAVQPQTIATYALRCLEHPEEAQRLRHALGVLRSTLGQGDSARRAARSVSHFLHLTATSPPARPSATR
jgi:lipid-A-disaccharide synthase